jgi:hypothetical protein
MLIFRLAWHNLVVIHKWRDLVNMNGLGFPSQKAVFFSFFVVCNLGAQQTAVIMMQSLHLKTQ